MQRPYGTMFSAQGEGRSNVLPIQRTSQATEIAEMLRHEMLSGVLRPGMLMYEADLVAHMGASRAVVREALGELAQEGLVVYTLQHGVQVTQTGPADIHDIYAVRRVYERAGLEALLQHRPVDTTWLRAATERMGEAAVSCDWRAAVEADIAFHLALVAAAGMRRLTAAAQSALMDLRLILPVADREADDLPALVSEHTHLVAVIEAGRLRKANAALEDHLLRGEAVALAAAVASEAA
jgi:DNA-binding GntR family transcriptional regulator